MKEQVNSTNLNIISDGTIVKGSLNSKSDTRLGGEVEGDLKVEGIVVVTESGFVNGSIHAENINVFGAVEGEMTATKKVILGSSSKMKGTVCAERLIIEEGAVFNGECLMGHESKTISSNFVPKSNVSDE